MNREVIGREGERVTCEQGHTIAIVKRTFGGLDQVASHLFDFGKAEPPATGTPFEAIRCQCGAQWVRVGSYHPAEICIEGEWR